jgi:hypothetical protein
LKPPTVEFCDVRHGAAGRSRSRRHFGREIAVSLGAKVFDEAFAANENARTSVSAELVTRGVRLTLDITAHFDLSLTDLAIVFAVAFLKHKATGSVIEYFHPGNLTDSTS